MWLATRALVLQMLAGRMRCEVKWLCRCGFALLLIQDSLGPTGDQVQWAVAGLPTLTTSWQLRSENDCGELTGGAFDFIPITNVRIWAENTIYVISPCSCVWTGSVCEIGIGNGQACPNSFHVLFVVPFMFCNRKWVGDGQNIRIE